jgi:eukaryotic-like serine/threonine-protein kinase
VARSSEPFGITSDSTLQPFKRGSPCLSPGQDYRGRLRRLGAVRAGTRSSGRASQLTGRAGLGQLGAGLGQLGAGLGQLGAGLGQLGAGLGQRGAGR